MPKEAKKATNLKVTGTKLIRRRIRDAERVRQGRKPTSFSKMRDPGNEVGKEASTTNSRYEQLGKNDGNKLDRKQCKLLSGPYDQY